MHALRTPAQALVCVQLGLLAVCLECAWPGRYVAGAAGAAACLLGGAALAGFALSGTGLALIVVAAVCFGLHARRRLQGLPLLAGAALLTVGLRFLVRAPALGWAAALGLSLPVSVALGVLLDIARRSRAAKRQPINTGLDAPHN